MACAYTIGIDEVGRGPIAGPVCVGACLVREARRTTFLSGIRDSKQLSEKKRLLLANKLFGATRKGECKLTTALVGEAYIDRRGISAALKLAVCRVLRKLGATPRACRILLDGSLYAPRTFVSQKTIIGGDESVPLIAAASIVAKVRRDRFMCRLARRYPHYGFERHKGYGTKKHYEALRKHGFSPVHRRSFLAKFEIRSTKSETISTS